MPVLRLFLLAIAVVCGGGVGRAAEAPPADVAWRLLDYIAVDYAEAVADGKIVNAGEYAEMIEFSASVRGRIAALPPTPVQAQLIADAEALQAAIRDKAEPADVAKRARKLGANLLAAYPTTLAPAQAPDLARAKVLYAEHCASCHGLTGAADGPAAKGLEPPVIAFNDLARARERSVFGLYQVISQGLEGTAMTSFGELPSDDRWGLAFYAGQMVFADAQAVVGQKLWGSRPDLRKRFADLRALTEPTPGALAAELGEADGMALTAYLRRHPEAVATADGGTLSIARAKLDECIAAYEAGDRVRARELALAAYLDGFEPVEPAIAARDAALMRRVEAAMAEVRSAIERGAPVADVRTAVAQAIVLLDEADRALAGDSLDTVSSFVGSFTILLREGLEALLIVVAMIAFLQKAERQDMLPYVHGGWIAALAAGIVTWVVATYLISISGASRELTEGFGSLTAAVVLISVGIWMHGKAQADTWQVYIREKMSKALSRRSAWFLFLLSFVVVYREVFETILFYAALWSQGGGAAMLAGGLAAAIVLAGLAWLLLTYSRRLPIAQFFRFSSILIAGLAVVLVGKGVAGLQEAGLIALRPISGLPRLDVIGLFPTWEGIVSQLVVLAVIVAGFWLNRRTAAGLVKRSRL
jgi:high-affinity iron transporter